MIGRVQLGPVALGAIMVLVLGAFLAVSLSAQNEAETVSELPCAPLAAYAADLVMARGPANSLLTRGGRGNARRNRDEIAAAQEALERCVSMHGLAAASP